MVRCKFGGSTNRGLFSYFNYFNYFSHQIGVLKDRLNSYGDYFLVRVDDKKCGEYKNRVKILSDSYKRAILEKKW